MRRQSVLRYISSLSFYPLYLRILPTSIPLTLPGPVFREDVRSDGQNVNWHVFGQDVPWIFSEIINQVNGDFSVSSRVRTSVDITWQNGSVTSGTTNFNNINIYQEVYDSTLQKLNYINNAPLAMEGQLQGFIESVPSGTWPTPAPTPSIK